MEPELIQNGFRFSEPERILGLGKWAVAECGVQLNALLGLKRNYYGYK